jgi:G:T-mismatch repair DNA endonuclease (very short patch repair protein)
MYLEMMHNIKIQGAHDGREKVIVCPPNKKYKVDGYFVDSSGIKTVVEFNGCYYHNHTCLAPNTRVHLRKPKPGDNNKVEERDFNDVEELGTLRRERTARKLRDLQESGYKVISMYECEFKDILKENPQIAKRLDTMLSTDTLKIRDSFFGGSVDATCTYSKVKDNEKIHYRDFTSLYPTVNMYDFMPTGPPKRIILGHEQCSKIDLMNFDGFIKARVLPPNNLFFGVLPCKVKNKLMFPLCYTCGEKQNKEACRHTDSQRSFVGTFVSIEFKLALEKGYKVQELMELQEFELRNDLFADYIKHFYVTKLQASGAPPGIDLDEFIEQYKQREGIDLDRNKFEKNPAKRTLAKLMLNT